MPFWVLTCPQCKRDFGHSEIDLEKGRREIWASPPKPEFPEGGSLLECPNCRTTSIFHRVQLRYAAYVRGPFASRPSLR
jgi:hypothetical protein